MGMATSRSFLLSASFRAVIANVHVFFPCSSMCEMTGLERASAVKKSHGRTHSGLFSLGGMYGIASTELKEDWQMWERKAH